MCEIFDGTNTYKFSPFTKIFETFGFNVNMKIMSEAVIMPVKICIIKVHLGNELRYSFIIRL